jgi:hypothetical protein
LQPRNDLIMSWTGFLKRFLAVLGLALGLLLGLIVLMNPFGNLPVRAFGAHVIMDTNDRFQFPAIVRSGAFDSVVIGTSSSRLLDPAWLERAFGGRFANLAFNDGRAWEEYQLTLLFLRTVPKPRTLLFGIDWVWCAATADIIRFTGRGFPPWISTTRTPGTIGSTSSTGGARKRRPSARQPCRAVPARFPATASTCSCRRSRLRCGESQAKCLARRGGADRAATAYVTTDNDPRPLAVSGAPHGSTSLPPKPHRHARDLCVHAGARGGPAAAGLGGRARAECKVRMAAIATRRGAISSTKIASPITTEDANYWDTLLSPADRAAHRQGIATAAAAGKDDPGDWRYWPSMRRRWRASPPRQFTAARAGGSVSVRGGVAARLGGERPRHLGKTSRQGDRWGFAASSRRAWAPARSPVERRVGAAAISRP